MSMEDGRRYSPEEAAAEAEKMRELAGENASAEDYEIAHMIIEEERATAVAKAAENPEERKNAEAAVEEAISNVESAAGPDNEPLIENKKRVRRSYEAVLPRHAMPTKAKRDEMEAAGLGIRTLVIIDSDRENPHEVNDEIGTVIRNGYQTIREKFRDWPSKESHYRRLDAATGQLVARHHPELLGLDSADMVALSKSEPGKYEALAARAEIRFAIAVKETELSAQPPQRIFAHPELPAQLPDKADIEEDVDGILGFEQLSAIDWDKMARPQSSNELLEPIPAEKRKEAIDAARSRMGRIPSEVRLLALRMGAAHRTGKWDDELVDDYIRLMDALPQYIHHRLAYLDLLLRANDKEIAMPKTMISVASGPLEEARAQQDLETVAAEMGLEAPKILNVDLNERMLSEGSRAFAEKFGKKAPSAEVRGSAFVLPVKDGAFDLSECSSLDSFSNPADVYLILSEMTRVTKPDGLLRIVFRRPLPDAFFAAAERDLGLKFLTEKHTKFALPKDFETQLRTDFGDDFVKRIERKIGKAEYILASRTEKAPKIMDRRTATGIFDSVIAERNADPGMSTAEQSGSLLEKLRRAAEETVNVVEYSTKREEVEAFVAPPIAAESASAAAPQFEPKPETAPQVTIEVEPVLKEEVVEQIVEGLDRIFGKAPKGGFLVLRNQETPMAKAMRKHVVDELKNSLRDDKRTVPASARAADFAEIAASIARSPHVSVRMLPRQKRIELLKRYDLPAATELYHQGFLD